MKNYKFQANLPFGFILYTHFLYYVRMTFYVLHNTHLFCCIFCKLLQLYNIFIIYITIPTTQHQAF